MYTYSEHSQTIRVRNIFELEFETLYDQVLWGMGLHGPWLPRDHLPPWARASDGRKGCRVDWQTSGWAGMWAGGSVVGPCGMRLLKLKLPVAVGGGLKVVTVKCYKLLAPFRFCFFVFSVRTI